MPKLRSRSRPWFRPVTLFTLALAAAFAVALAGTPAMAGKKDKAKHKVKKIKAPQEDTCGYPNADNPPRSLVTFSESEVLRSFAPQGTAQVGSAQQIRVWYNDEHALLLGIRQVAVKTKNGITTTDYPVSPTPASATCMPNPEVGTMAMSGDQAGVDVADGGGRPIWPALFITDLTAAAGGDWQHGGTAIPPHQVCGTWKAAVKTIDMTHDPARIEIQPDADPAKVGWNLGAGGDTPPEGFAALKNEGYGAECIWNIDQLGLIPGHDYEFQVMVHDGDQNKQGGDCGEACLTLTAVPGDLQASVAPLALCEGTSGQLCAAIDPAHLGTPPYQYLWNTGETTACITVNAPAPGATDSYSVEITDQAGRMVTATGEVTGTASPHCLISGPGTICAGQPTEICGPDGPGLSYLWSTGETSRCISVTAQATYTLTVSGGSCGPQTCSKALLASSPPLCSITGPDSICSGQSAQLCGPEGFQGTVLSYLWSTGETTRCITIHGPGNYKLTVSTPTCGSSTCTKTVTPGTAIACSITGPDDLDPGATGQLCGPEGAGLTYQWSTGETTRCITIDSPATYTLTVTSPTCGNSTCSKTVLDRPTSSCRCSFFYPDDSHLPRSAQSYHESDLLRAVVPGRNGCPLGDHQLKLWYNDESALGLGIRRVVVYTSPTDSTVTYFPVSPSPASPACVPNPQLGATAQTGLMTGNDTAVDGGRPIWPVLYVTDITFDKYARDGDWEQGGTAAVPADRVCGVWTTGVRRVFTYLGNQVAIAMDPSPAPNHWTLGAGGDTPPGGFGTYADEGYGAEVSWDLSKLGFQPGHRYRLYTILHDGDQDAADGGDAAHACSRVVVAQNGAMTLDTGDMESSDPARLTSSVQQFELSQNIPNPFKVGAQTSIRFAIPEKSQVRIEVFTIAGQKVATLADGIFDPGARSVVWNGVGDSGNRLAAGMYFCKLQASSLKSGRFVQMRKMVMIN